MTDKDRRENQRRFLVKKTKENRRQFHRRQWCSFCNMKMEKVEREIEGAEGEKFTAYECPSCGRHEYVDSLALRRARIVNLKTERRKVIKFGTSLALIIPKEFVEALHLGVSEEVDITVEGISKIVLRFIRGENIPEEDPGQGKPSEDQQ